MSTPASNHDGSSNDTETFSSEPSEVEAASESVLEDCLQQLVDRGPVEEPGALIELLPASGPQLRRFVLLELIKLDMAMHAESGRVPRLEAYLAAFPDTLDEDEVPIDLVLEEIQLRRELGEEPAREEYRHRFPRFDATIAHLLRGAEATAALGKLRKPPELTIGSEVDDFTIVHKLGEGAFAQVFLARQNSMHRLVALKVSMGTGDEPQALAQFDHPNIVRVFDQRNIDDPPVHLLYMQYHPGGTLAEVVATVRATPDQQRTGGLLLETVDRSLLRASQVVPDRSSVRRWIETVQWPMVVAWIGVQIAHALQEAHELGMLHRDVKPANVLLTAEGIPKLADFNVSFAGAAGRAGAAATFGGSIGYMAPEHLRAISPELNDPSTRVGLHADLYSLAILLWELWQGHRPFQTDSAVKSWSDAISQQLARRSEPLEEPSRRGTASERVLENTLRSALQYDIEKRPSQAAAMAGQLKLALHPEAAALLDPAEWTKRAWIAKRSPWLVAGAIILIPNIAAGLLNYEYNTTEIQFTDTIRESLKNLARWVNAIVYPLGVVLMVIYTKGLVGAIKSTRAGERITNEQLNDTLGLGHRAALIGGSCWIGAGIAYTVILAWMHPEFTSTQAIHFFTSMVICGGVAMVYPMFGVGLLATFVYYPMLVRGTMQDTQFERHRSQMIRRCEAYLLIAILIPLLAAALLISSESSSREFMLTAIAAGVLGLFASFFAYRLIVRTWDRFAEVLSNQTSVIPG